MSPKSAIQLFGLSEQGAVALPVAEDAAGFDDLYDGFELGVYTALRTYRHNRFLDLTHHLERTRRSMARFGMDYTLDVRRIRRALHEVCTAYPGADMRVRIDVLATHSRGGAFKGRELIALVPFTAPDPERYWVGARVATTTALQRADPLTKSADFVARRKAVLAAADGVEEVLLVDRDGRVLEGVSSNFYAVVGGQLRTADECVLEGVTRAIVLQLAAQLKLTVALQAATRDELAEASEAAISSSSRGLMPVVAVDRRAVGQGKVGPVMTMLMQAYEQYLSEHLRLAHEA